MLTGTVTKPYPKGNFHARRRVRADKGGSLRSAGITGAVLGLLVLSAGVLLELRRGSGTHFPASQVPFPPAVPNSRSLCSQIWESVCGEVFQSISTPQLPGRRAKVWMDGPCEVTLE